MLQDIEKMKVQYLMNLLFDLFEILQAVFKFYLKQVKDISKCRLCTYTFHGTSKIPDLRMEVLI